MRPQTEREIYQRRQHGSAQPGQAEQHQAHQAEQHQGRNGDAITPAIDYGARNRAEALALLAKRDELRARIATQTGAAADETMRELMATHQAMKYCSDQDVIYDARQAETATHRTALNKVCASLGLGRWLDPDQRRAAMIAAAAVPPVASLAVSVSPVASQPDVIAVPPFARPAADAVDAATARAGWLGRGIQALLRLRQG